MKVGDKVITNFGTEGVIDKIDGNIYFVRIEDNAYVIKTLDELTKGQDPETKGA